MRLILAVPVPFRHIQNKFTARLGALLCIALLIAPALLLAQNATTSLRGTVTDPSGAAVPGATITLTNLSTNRKLTATSNGSGEYHLAQLAPAKYSISSKAAGFSTQTRTAELLVDQPATVNFAMSVTADATVVDVSTTTETINTTDASLGIAHDNAFVQSIPSETRNVPDLLSLQPGVFFMNPPGNDNDSRNAVDSRSGSVSGVRSDQSNMTLDGIDDNNQVNGYAFTGVLRETQDAILEFRVITGNGNADAGRSAGAQVSMITKSGTNTTHGAVYGYYRPSNTVSNDFFNKNSQLQSGQANAPPTLTRKIFGADFGDAIIKDKLFYFANYEGQRLNEDSVQTWGVPTAAYKAGSLLYQNDVGGVTTLTPAQVTALDPNGIGPDAAMLTQFFGPIPAANGSLLGDGLNTGSYTFSSPFPRTQNTSIVRVDYIFNDHHKVFVRLGYQKDVTSGPENFPGQGPSYSIKDNTKGIIMGHTWAISDSMVNDIRYGYIRQGAGRTGNSANTSFTNVRFFTNGNGSTDATPTSQIRSTFNYVPVNNIVDNFNWTKGHHNIQLGVNWRLIHQNRVGTVNSYSFGITNSAWLDSSSQQGVDPTTTGNPGVDPGFLNSYGIAFDNLLGLVSQVTNLYNYVVTSPNAATLVPEGTPLARHFSANEYEGYVQDQWRALTHLTLTFGVRYTLLQTPWETKGQQVTPTIDMHAWFIQREAAAQKGQIDQPDLSFAPAGKFYGRPGFYPETKNNWAPRFAVAYSPNDKTSIRAGAGLYYSHFGESLIDTFDQNGEFGLSSTVTNQAQSYGISTAPRFTSYQGLPYDNGTPPSSATFPYTYPDFTDQAVWGVDNKMKTPYILAYDFSVQRQVPGAFTVDIAYVGRFGKHLLQQTDLAQPVDYVDPAGGGDYYTAAVALSKQVDINGQDPSATVAPIPYFEHVFSYMQGYDAPGESATQAIYTNEWAPNRSYLGETTALEDLDLDCFNYGTGTPYPCTGPSRFYNNQFTSLFALTSNGSSWYNALQITITHPMRHGFDMDLYYTLSKSMDMGSDAERFTTVSANSSISAIGNTWKPQLNRAVSDFDTRHMITADAIYELPIGRGKQFLSGISWPANSVIGGWQVTGTYRWTSGLPFAMIAPSYNTDWQLTGNLVNNVGFKPHKQFDPSSGLYRFISAADAAKINAGVNTGTFFRLPYPGELGQRNNFRGDGNLELDMTLSKSWAFHKYGTVKFTWEVYNVTNTNRFDPFEILTTAINNSNSTLGNATGLMSTNRRMQFSLRYDF